MLMLDAQDEYLLYNMFLGFLCYFQWFCFQLFFSRFFSQNAVIGGCQSIFLISGFTCKMCRYFSAWFYIHENCMGIIYLVLTQNFPKEKHFLLPDTNTYVLNDWSHPCDCFGDCFLCNIVWRRLDLYLYSYVSRNSQFDWGMRSV